MRRGLSGRSFRRPASSLRAASPPYPNCFASPSPFLAPEGACLFLKGADVETELTEAALEWQMHVERFPSWTSPRATVLRITELHRVASVP